jgi:hypothetical protein
MTSGAGAAGRGGLPGASGDQADGAMTSGAGAALSAAYALFALAAGARSALQIATRLGEAPLAYGLSAVAAALYLLGALSLRRPTRRRRRLALGVCGLEVGGVLAVGTLSLLVPSAFADETVWSGYGQGYGFLPLALPVLGLAWLRATRCSARTSEMSARP